jgi:hypothetical protein
MKTKVCKSCGYVGKPVHDEGAAFFMDLFLWLMIFAIAGITAIFPLVVIAPMLTLVHIYYYRSKKCPKCEDLEMVSLSGHDGKAILEPHQGEPHAWSDHHHVPSAHH